MNKTLLTILLALTAVSALAQQTVSGVVKDSQGAPIEQVNVVITGTKAYAVTDSQGAFTLTFSAPLPVVVRVSSVGYKTQEVQLDSPDRQLEITLAEDVLLSEVVITARRRKEVAQKVPIA
ncbi:MAG TPA: carboxypeptidase-like regulatory domain-containing protein, partial [Cyclobacteriaceae bacterium]|nr:carboxypeptidase-like regulatory domain-containing protein [Cyclobacteriaceae bacterium]